MSKKIMSVAQCADRANWLKMRTMGLGGSDAASVMGLNKWKSPYQLWLEKTGQVEAEDISDRECVYWGTVLEDVVAQEFFKRTGKRIQRCGMLQDDEHDFLLANVDRLIIGEKAGLECKTANGFAAKLWEGDEVPDAYYLQCQHYMMVTGYDKWYIAALIGGNHFVWKEIPRNEEDILALREAEVIFWNRYVLGGEMPQVDGSDDCSRALARHYPGGIKDEDADLNELQAEVDEIGRLKEMVDGLNKQITEKENRIKDAMGDFETGYCGETKITWRSSAGRVTLDSKKLQAEMPEVYEKYKKQGAAYRVFKIN